MGYCFQGIFAVVADEATINLVCQEIRTLWTQALCRRVQAPFHGVGISCTADGCDSVVEQAQLDDELKAWTPRFPELTFVRLEVECFGGVCLYAGAVWHNGALVWREEGDDGDNAPLISLLRYLGVTSANGYFEPLTRGYFAHGLL